MRFNAAADYAPGRTLAVADTLSRSPAVSTTDSNKVANVDCYVNSVISAFPASRRKLDKIRKTTLADSVLQAVVRLVRNVYTPQQETIITTEVSSQRVMG